MNKRQAAKPKPWNRKLWAVEMRSKSCKPEGMLLGKLWQTRKAADYEGEPVRCLLFATREQALVWCRLAVEVNAKTSPDWRFRPVRVTETITRVRK